MEYNRSIEKGKIGKIIKEFKEEHQEELRNFSNILEETERNMKFGEEFTIRRRQFYCGNLISIIENNRNNNSELILFNYSSKEYLNDRLKACYKSSDKYPLSRSYLDLKEMLGNIKEKENKNLRKCFVMCFSENEIKDCLFKKFVKLRNTSLKDINLYYSNLSKSKL
jgi:hypothetical protein